MRNRELQKGTGPINNGPVPLSSSPFFVPCLKLVSSPMFLRRLDGSVALEYSGLLRKTDFAGKDLSHVVFAGENLEGALFDGADCRGAIFRAADLYWARFFQANLEGSGENKGTGPIFKWTRPLVLPTATAG